MVQEEIMESHRIIFTGDISFSGYFSGCYQGKGCLSPEVLEYLNAADDVVGNVECPITNRQIQSKRRLNHSSPMGAGKFLANCNICIWNLANNHIMDCLEDGLHDTLTCAKDNKCCVLGSGKNLEEASRPVILGDKVKIGILSVVPPWTFVMAGENAPGAFPWTEESIIKQRLHEIKLTADWAVIIAHSGDEFADIPRTFTREQYRKFISWGADIVVGHHPHVPQCYEMSGNKAIFYSLGNFIFDTDYQRAFPHTDIGIILGLNFLKESFSFDFLPLHINRETQSVEKGNIPAVFRNMDSAELKNAWYVSVRSFIKKYARRRMMSMPNEGGFRIIRMALQHILLWKYPIYRSAQADRIGKFLKGGGEHPPKELVEYLKQF